MAGKKPLRERVRKVFGFKPPEPRIRAEVKAPERPNVVLDLTASGRLARETGLSKGDAKHLVSFVKAADEVIGGKKRLAPMTSGEVAEVARQIHGEWLRTPHDADVKGGLRKVGQDMLDHNPNKARVFKSPDELREGKEWGEPLSDRQGVGPLSRSYVPGYSEPVVHPDIQRALDNIKKRAAEHEKKE